MIILGRLLRFLWQYKQKMALAYFCLFASTIFAMAVPWLIKEVIDTGLTSGQRSFLILSALAVIAVSALRGAFSYGQSYLTEFLSQRVAYDIRNSLYDKLQRLSFGYHDKAQTGQLMSRATADVEAVRLFISMGWLRLAYFVVLFLFTCFLLVSLNWRLALISFACLPFLGWRATIVSRHLRPMWMKIQQAMAAMSTVLQENLAGVRVVKAFAREEHETEKFGARAMELRDLNLDANREWAYNTPLMAFILTASTGLILWYGGREVINGQLSLGELVAFNSYLLMLAMPVRTLGWMINIFSRAISAGQRIFEILDAESPVKEMAGAIPLTKVQGHVRFEGVSFSYDSVSPTLKNINLEARPGEVVALLGATGSGKSTIINLIPRFYDVTAGRITIDGIDIRRATLASLRRNVGVVLQDTFLFAATISDNVAYGAVDAKMEDIVAAAKVAGIHDFIVGLPDGYDTWVGERGITLSGGQKQRVAIARTLLLNPRILILDDSTSSVDTETEHLIQQALAAVMKGRTTFVITQRLATIMNAHQILVLKDGEIMERGQHEELLAKGGIYRQTYDLQIRDQEEALARVPPVAVPRKSSG